MVLVPEGRLAAHHREASEFTPDDRQAQTDGNEASAFTGDVNGDAPKGFGAHDARLV
jgi:hypothetical protein